MVVAIETGGLMDVLPHPNPTQYPRQRILVVELDRYAYLVPFVEEEDYYFLKPVIPSRQATRPGPVAAPRLVLRPVALVTIIGSHH